MTAGWWGVPSLAAGQAQRIVELSIVDGLSLRAVADQVGTSKDSARRVLAAARNPVANLPDLAAGGLATDGAAIGAAERQRPAQTVRLGPANAVPPYRSWVVEVDGDGLVVCPVCRRRVPIETALHHTGSIPSGVLLPMPGHGEEFVPGVDEG